MLKVILADDEPVIIKGLKGMYPWEEFNMVIVGEARNGRELWEKVKQEEPDIVISDICMPGMTGLEFLKHLKNENIKTQVIFISGYQKFEYVQEAIRFGAVDYILKPILKSAMDEALKKAMHQFQNQEKLELFKEETNELQDLLYKFSANSKYEKKELYESFCRLGIDYKKKIFTSVSFYLSNKTEKKLKEEQYGKKELVRFSAFNRIQKFFRECKKGFPMKLDEEYLNILCVLEASEKDEFLQNYIVRVIEQIEGDMKIELGAGVGFFSDNPIKLEYLYNSSKFAYEMRYFLDMKIICADNIHRSFSSSFEDYNQLYKKILDELMDRNTEVKKDFNECMNLIKNLHYGNRYAVINRCILFAGSLYENLKEYGTFSEEDEKRQGEFMEKIRTAETFGSLREQFLEYYEELTEQFWSCKTMWNHPTIAKVIEYIKENYEQDINMQKMAEMACVNPVYFSALFKKTTGKKFKEFLTDVRMEEAKKLVITTDMKTYEIAEKVGYHNVRQFTDQFRKYYGLSPAEYKKKLIEKSVVS